MKTEEKMLFKSLCSFKSKEFDEALLDAATPTVLGQLFFNRMQAIAYGRLVERGLLGKVNREFRNSLKGAYDNNLKKNNSFFECVRHVEAVLSQCGAEYAMLKGAYLCKGYPEGYRTSNDIDLLVRPQNVSSIGAALLADGFVQGTVCNGRIEPATRKQIIASKMMRGETVPYIKEVGLPEMQFLEVDVNFSLDYKPGDTRMLEELMRRACIREVNGLKIKTLQEDDFFIHLCCHLYKEATTLPWVEMKRDMTLYKYCDIYLLLEAAEKEKIDAFFERATLLGMDAICAFAVVQMSELFLFTNNYAIKAAQDVLKTKPTLIHTVISPKENKIYMYKEKDISKRFFSDDRKNDLKEVKL